MTRKIIIAYKTILVYVDDQHACFFQAQEVEKYLSAEEWCKNRFGQNPLWENHDQL